MARGDKYLRFVPWVAVTVVVAVVVSLAVTSQGVVNRVMDLHNSGVWVTNDSQGLFGRANRSAGVLDAALSDPNRESVNGHVDVFQDGEAVVAWSRDESRLFSVDTRLAKATPDVPQLVGLLSSVAMGGNVLATISADKGDVRTTRYTPDAPVDLAGLGVGGQLAAQITVASGLQAGVDVAVDSHGQVFAAAASGDWVLISADGDANYGSLGQTLRSVAVSLVGGVGVVTDQMSGEVFTTAGDHYELDAGVVPQQPSDGSRIIVATPSGLSSLAGGNVSSVYDVPGTTAGAQQVIAEPVVMGTVVYGAWGGTPGQVVRIDGGDIQEDMFPADGSLLSKPVFRVNHGSVVLNDMATGTVFDVDEELSMDNWEDVAPDATELNGNSSSSSQDSPQATDDQVWARAGRMAVIHVLDNDVNPGTGIVAITEVSGPDAGNVVISPDGQTLLASVPADQEAPMSLRYTITNRAVSTENADVTSNANVTISMRPPAENNLPYHMGTQGSDEATPDYTVPSGGALSVAPAGWWRDPDSDPVMVVSASVGDRVLPVSAQGLIQYKAVVSEGQITERVDYMVSDGAGKVAGVIWVRVMPDSALTALPPVAMSDSVRGVAGQSVVFFPLDNDIPGSDPLDKQAQLKLASPLGARVGMQVSTDLLSGAVTVSAERAGAYFLDYVVSFGAGFATGKIRVDIVAADDVVAMPDTAVIHGTVPVVVDVVSNDRDPIGSVLTVTSAIPRDPDRVRIGIIQGRWLRIDPTSSVTSSALVLIDYTVTNGVTSTVGQVSVTQEPAVSVDHVSVVDDVARVRAGDVTTIPVLDNDSSESGEPLVITDNVPSMAHAGQLRVEDPSAPAGQEDQNVGSAFVNGKTVRYEAPASVDGPKKVRIEYQAGVAWGSPMTGYVWVDIVPEPDQQMVNNVPTPESLDARVIVGDAVRIPVTIYGQDPDGDSVTVAGLRTPPKFGQVVEFGADYLTYESYPDVGNTGMDSFQFYVQDRFGATGMGTVRIGLSAPGDVPAPLGVDDVVTAQPGVPVSVYPVTNDVVPIGTGEVHIDMDDPNVVVDQDAQMVATTAPGENAPAVSLGYHLDAGGVIGTSAQIMVRSQVGYLNPPKITDHAAEDVNDGVASVDVLEDAWDVDGPDDAIHIVSVGPQASFVGSVVSVPILDRGQVVSYVVEDGDGAQAMAVVFVPSLTDGRPTLKAGGLIRMDRNGTEQVALNDYIESPRNELVHLTMGSQAWTAPGANLSLTVGDDQHVTLRARNDYVGPAALTVEVRDSPDATDPSALTGVVTIPVQIGAATPVLWCPDDVLDIVQGGVARTVDVAELCHAWMPTQSEIDSLRFTGSWAQGGDGITVGGRDRGPLPSDVLVLQALPASVPDMISTLTVGVDGFDVTDQLNVRVIAAPKPTMSVSSVADVLAGTTVDVPVTITSQMLNAVQNIVSVTLTSGGSGSVRFDDRTIEVTPNQAGTLVYEVVGSDIADDSRTDRQVRGSFSVTVYGPPEAPGAPQPGTQLRTRSAVVTFIPGADNGAPILGYEVQLEDGRIVACGLNTTCEITGLTNGVAYRFQVRAINKAGPSPWSDWGPEVIPNAIPGAVTNFTASNPSCGSVQLSWGATQGEGTAPTMFHLTWDGLVTPVSVNGSDSTYTPTGLDNNNPYKFTIVAENEAGLSHSPITVMGQSSCRPIWQGAGLTVEPHDMGDTAQITVRWPDTVAEGPDPVTYTVTRTGPDGTKIFAPTTENSLGDTGDEITYDGQTYTYHVTATNATGGPDHTSDELSASFDAYSSPASWASPDDVSVEATGVNNQVRVHVNSFPRYRDASGHVNYTLTGTCASPAPHSCVMTGELTSSNASADVNGLVNGASVSVDFQAVNTRSLTNNPLTIVLGNGSFGDLLAPSLSAVTGSGRTVCYSASGDGNGRGAVLVVTADNGIGEVYRSSTLTVSNRCVDALTWDTQITFTAHLESVPTTPGRSSSPNATYRVRSAVGTPDPWDPAWFSVTGNGQNNQVTLTVTQFPASNGGHLVVTYTVVETGVTGTIPSPGQVTVTGLPANGVDYNFRLTADNGTNTSVSSSKSAHAYGPFDAPVLTPQDGQGTKACVKVTTASTGTNGDSAYIHIEASVSGSNTWDSPLTNGPIDTGVRCFETGEYNKSVTFTATLTPGSGQTRNAVSSTGTSLSSIGTPGNLSSSAIQVTPTGRGGQALITLVGPLPAHNGGSSDYLRVTVTGLPGASTLTLTESSPTATVNGFTDATPTTLTFTACNQKNCSTSVTKTVTTAGPLGTPVRVSGGPVAEYSTNKQVCAVFSANTNGGRAQLTVTNNLDSSQSSTKSGTGTLVSDPVCVTASGAERPVNFTATITDEAGLSNTRSQESVTWTGYSAKDAGPLTYTTPTIATTYDNYQATPCFTVTFNPNGADANGYLAVSPASASAGWHLEGGGASTGPWRFSVPAGATVTQKLCGTVPADGSTYNLTVQFTEASDFHRATASSTTPFTIDHAPGMTLTAGAAGPESGDPSTNKRVCAAFSADGGGLSVTLTISAAGQSDSRSGNAPSFSYCVDSGGASRSVTFTASLADSSQYHRAITPVTTTVTSAADPVVEYHPTVSLRLDSSDTWNGYRRVQYATSGWPSGATVSCEQISNAPEPLEDDNAPWTATADGAWHPQPQGTGSPYMGNGLHLIVRCSTTYNGNYIYADGEIART